MRAAVIEEERALEDEKTKGTPSSQFVNNCRANENMVTPEVIKMINKILENDSPPELCKALEIFVGLLRNKANTKPADVELFFGDASKLVSKMSKTKTTSVDLELAEDSLEELKKLNDAFSLEQEDAKYDLSYFDCFVKWSINYCLAAQIDLRQASMQQKIDNMKLDIERAQLVANRFTEIFRGIEANNMEAFYLDGIQALQTRLTESQTIGQNDRNQAEAY